jgi:hypothetical protein
MLRIKMGYKYGVWIVLKPDDINYTIKHIPHITIMCNMTYENAFQYYRELLWNGYSKITIAIHRPVVLFPKHYKEDLLDAWGYYITMHPKTYLDMQKKSKKYNGEFSDIPHLSLEYTTKVGKDYQGKTMIEGTICFVDITSDNPSLWKIIN